MKKVVLVFAIMFAISSLFARKSNYLVSFGSGGGVTGIYITYTLDSKDRKIIKTLSSKETKDEVAVLGKKQIKDIGNQIKVTGFPSLKVNAPGNMSYYVNVVIDGTEYKTIWAASPAGSGNKPLDALYKNLMALVQKK